MTEVELTLTFRLADGRLDTWPCCVCLDPDEAAGLLDVAADAVAMVHDDAGAELEGAQLVGIMLATV